MYETWSTARPSSRSNCMKRVRGAAIGLFFATLAVSSIKVLSGLFHPAQREWAVSALIAVTIALSAAVLLSIAMSISPTVRAAQLKRMFPESVIVSALGNDKFRDLIANEPTLREGSSPSSFWPTFAIVTTEAGLEAWVGTFKARRAATLNWRDIEDLVPGILDSGFTTSPALSIQLTASLNGRVLTFVVPRSIKAFSSPMKIDELQTLADRLRQARVPAGSQRTGLPGDKP